MKFSNKLRIRRKPSAIQRATCAAVEHLEIEHGSMVDGEAVRLQMRVPRLKTMENRLNTYARKGWLRVSTQPGRAAVYGVSNTWIDLLDACDAGHVKIKMHEADTVGHCELCGRRGRLIRFKKLHRCKQCLNPDEAVYGGDTTHPLVVSNWEEFI